MPKDLSLSMYRDKKGKFVSLHKDTIDLLKKEFFEEEKIRKSLEEQENSHNRINKKLQESLSNMKRQIKTVQATALTYIGFLSYNIDKLRAETIGTFGEISPAIDEINKKTLQTFKTFTSLNVEISDIVDSAISLSKLLGTSRKVTQSLLNDAVKLKAAFDISAEDSSRIAVWLNQSNISSDMFYKNLQAGSDFSKVIAQDITGMIGVLRMYKPNNLLKAAKYARSLSISIKDAADSLSEFSTLSTALDKTLKINILLGSKLDASYLFQANMMGDIEGATKHIVKNLSDAHFESIPYLGIQKLIAGELGFSVDQLHQMIAAHKDPAVRLNLEKQADLTKLLKDRMTSINKLWVVFKETALVALGPYIDSLNWVVTNTSKWIDNNKKLASVIISVGAGLLTVFTISEGIAKLLKSSLILEPLRNKILSFRIGIQKRLNMELEKTAVLESKTSMKSTGMFATGKAGFAKNMIVGAAAIGILSVSMLALAKSFQMFSDVNWVSVWSGIGTVTALTAAMFGLGSLLASGVGTVLFGAGVLGILSLAGAVGVLGTSMLLLASGLERVDKVSDRINQRTMSAKYKMEVDYDRMAEGFSEALKKNPLKIDGSSIIIKPADIYVGTDKVAKIMMKAQQSVT